MTDNFNLPIDLSRLQNDRLRLVPLEDDLSEYAAIWVHATLAHPEIYTWLTYGPFTSSNQYVGWYDTHVRHDRSTILFAILLKSGSVVYKDPTTGETTTTSIEEGTFAGIAGLVSQSERATVDMGQMLLPRFQRTFVGQNSLAVLLHHCLDEVEKGGLGLRRVQWQANARNVASVNAAKRLGFRLEGVVRWQQVLPVGKMGEEMRVADRVDREESRKGRHTVVLALCWDDWADGGKEHVDALAGR